MGRELHATSSKERPAPAPPHARGYRVAAILVWLAVAILWLSTMWRLRNPFPFSDDYNSCLMFLCDWLETRDPRLFFATYNEAPNLLLRLTVVGSYYLFGSVSFSSLAILASLSPLLFAFALAWWFSYRSRTAIAYGLALSTPVLLLVAQPAAWGSYLWATSAYIHGFLPLMALLSLIALERGAIFSGLTVALLAAFFGGAGIFITLMACSLVVFRWRRSPIVLALLGFGGVGIAIRLYSMSSNGLLHTNVRSFLGEQGNLSGILLYTLAVIGNAVDLSNPYAAAGLGLVVLIVAASQRADRDIPLTSVLVLAVCAGASSAVLRFPGGGLPHALLSRYQVYSTAAWGAVYVLILLRWPRQRLWVCALSSLAAAAFAYHTYLHAPSEVTTFNLRQARELVASRFDPSVVLAEFPPRSATDQALQRAESFGIYTPDPAVVFRERVERDVAIPDRSADLSIRLSLYQRDDRFVFVRGRVAIQAGQAIAPRSLCLIALKKHQPTSNVRLCLPAVRGKDLLAEGVRPPVEQEGDKAVEFALLLPTEDLPAEDYDLALMVLGKRNWHMKLLPPRSEP